MPGCKQISVHKASNNQVEAWVPVYTTLEHKGISEALAHATINTAHFETLSSSLKRMVSHSKLEKLSTVDEKSFHRSEYISFPRYEVLKLDSEHTESESTKKSDVMSYLLEYFSSL
ncbi:hypothetical protein K7432_001089 [Basidiobolus ranarum]|uniref:Uncharacterized protein n=1 Tax=Basidiobolus ranarum TaxID=34480 RepID=A0ABR2X3L0_9FUNG